MTPSARLVDRLSDVRPAGRGQWRARCPSCSARTSLSVREVDGGRLLVHCHAGCAASEVLEAIGLRLSDLFDAPVADRIGPIPSSDRIQPDRAALVNAAASEATVAALLASDAARGMTVDVDRLALAAGRLLRFAEHAR